MYLIFITITINIFGIESNGGSKLNSTVAVGIYLINKYYPKIGVEGRPGFKFGRGINKYVETNNLSNYIWSYDWYNKINIYHTVIILRYSSAKERAIQMLKNTGR